MDIDFKVCLKVIHNEHLILLSLHNIVLIEKKWSLFSNNHFYSSRQEAYVWLIYKFVWDGLNKEPVNKMDQLESCRSDKGQRHSLSRNVSKLLTEPCQHENLILIRLNNNSQNNYFIWRWIRSNHPTLNINVCKHTVVSLHFQVLVSVARCILTRDCSRGLVAHKSWDRFCTLCTVILTVNIQL